MKKLIQMNILTLKNIKTQTMVYGLLTGFLASLILIHAQPASAYIPELPFILKKSSLTTGKKIIQIEQEVIFKSGEDEARVDEVWLVEGDRNLKMTAIGKNLYKENIRLNYLYNGKNRTHFLGKNKVVQLNSPDFYEKYLFIRSRDSFLNYLRDLNIPANVRLSRANGVITFLIGQPSEQNLNPHIWIGQDDFVIRKIRMPSAAEISLDQVTSYPNDTYIAKSQTISWPSLDGGPTTTVQIRIKKVNVNAPGSIQSFYPNTIDFPSEINFANKTELTSVIEEFYSRFR